MIYGFDLKQRRDASQRLLGNVLERMVYIVFASELGIECRDGLGGCASAWLSDAIRERLPEKFRGPAPAMLINDSVLSSLEPFEAAAVFDSIVLHEAGHLAIEQQHITDYPTYGGAAVVSWAESPKVAEPLKWLTHHGPYIRAMLHIHHRFSNRKHRVHLPAAFNGRHYGLSSINRYLGALGDEPAHTDWLPLTEVLAKPAPTEFTKLWMSDVARSLTNPQSSKGTTNANA